MINERIVIEEKTKDYNEAWIETYFWQESEELYPGQKRPVIVICPGGAYCMTSDREAEAIAVRFMGMGYHTVVLRYSVAPARYPVALRQLAKTVALLRENSDKWHIEKNKIIVSGFFSRWPSGSFSGSILEYGGACRNHGNGKREDPSQWYDPELSGDHFRGSWS